MKQKVIVLGRNYTSRLGMIRAAGMAGYKVIVIKTEHGSGYKKEKIDQSSKYVCDYYCAPEPNEDELVAILNDKCKSETGKNIIIPTDDYTASVIDRRQRELENNYLFPNINHEPGAVVYYMNKELQKELARKAGLRVAEGWNARFDGKKFELPEGVVFPCFVKPRISFEGSKFYMKKCASKEELLIHFDAIAKDLIKKNKKTDLLIEQFIQIEKEYVISGVTNGKDVFIPIFIEKGLIHLGVTGTGTLINSLCFEDTVKKLQEMVKEFGFIGLIDIEMYESKGALYFNELNMRFGAAGYAVTAVGINLPNMLIQQLKGEDPEYIVNNQSFEGKQFASEKVCYQEYRDHLMDWKTFCKTIQDADYTFIGCDDDRAPGKVFWRSMRIFKIKRTINKIIKRK